MNRRSFLRTGAASTAILFAAPVWCADAEPGPPSDSELVSEARTAIDRHRTIQATLRVLNQNGKPVPGAKVFLEQLHHDFLFGCNAFVIGRCTDPDSEEAYRRRFAALFNYCTLGFYWAAYEIRQGQPNYAYTDQVLEWTSQQGIKRADMSPKPAYEQLLHVIRNQWWTRAGGRTDDGGIFRARAFYGQYRVTAEQANGQKTVSEIQVQRGQSNPIDLTI